VAVQAALEPDDEEAGDGEVEIVGLGETAAWRLSWPLKRAVAPEVTAASSSKDLAKYIVNEWVEEGIEDWAQGKDNRRAVGSRRNGQSPKAKRVKRREGEEVWQKKNTFGNRTGAGSEADLYTYGQDVQDVQNDDSAIPRKKNLRVKKPSTSSRQRHRVPCGGRDSSSWPHRDRATKDPAST
jgi:hypothetical protein